jgi:hypothetical protein
MLVPSAYPPPARVRDYVTTKHLHIASPVSLSKPFSPYSQVLSHPGSSGKCDLEKYGPVSLINAIANRTVVRH